MPLLLAPYPSWIPPWLISFVDLALVVALVYLVLLLVGERRTLWLVRGMTILLAVLMLAIVASRWLDLEILNFVLEKLAIGLAVAAAVIFQSELRRFLEQLGRGEVRQLFQSSRVDHPKPDSVIDEIVDAVKDLSQNRTGALIVLETSGQIDRRAFSVPGVPINAEVSKELLQTIFQTSTLLHDGAVLIRGSRIVSAGVILPISERTASRQLGTRHRAAMGITERVSSCLCIVVSEETGSISLAERGALNRPLTRTQLKDLLEVKFSSAVEREAVAPGIGRLSRRLGFQGRKLLKRFTRCFTRSSHDKK